MGKAATRAQRSKPTRWRKQRQQNNPDLAVIVSRRPFDTPTALKAALVGGQITPETPVMHTLAPTLGASGTGMIPLSESWAKRYL